jgi:hypothetical protein
MRAGKQRSGDGWASWSRSKPADKIKDALQEVRVPSDRLRSVPEPEHPYDLAHSYVLTATMLKVHTRTPRHGGVAVS